jgi:hypothetical protein
MGLECSVHAVQWLAADPATTTYDITTTFEAKAAIAFCMGLGSETDLFSNTVHSRRSIGFGTTTSNRRSVTTQDQNAADPTVCTAGYRDDCLIHLVTSTPAVDGRLDINAISSTLFQLIVDQQAPVNISVFIMLIGGSDIRLALAGDTPEPGATGDQDYSVPGFVASSNEDQVVFFAGVNATGASPAAERQDSTFYIGAAGGDTLNNVVSLGASRDAQATSSTGRYGRSGDCLARFSGGALDARASLTQFGTDNFRLNWAERTTTDRRGIFLAIKGGRWRVGEYIVNATVLGARIKVKTGFEPRGILAMTERGTESASDTGASIDWFALGIGTSTSSRMTQGTLSNTGAAAAAVSLAIDYSLLMTNASVAAVEQENDIAEIARDSFTVENDIADTDAQIDTWNGFVACGNRHTGVYAT